MKKKIVCICVIAAVVSVAGLGFATGTVQKTVEDVQLHIAVRHNEPGAKERLENHERKDKIDKKRKSDSWSKLNKFDQMREAMDATIGNPIDYNNILFNYEYLRQAYHFEQEQLDYIADLIIKGYDAGDVMNLCYFWIDTNEDISIIEEMYLQKGVTRGNAWIEKAFNKATDDKHGVLTTEDVEAYIEDGLTVDDIILANKLCRRGAMTIQEILEEHKQGKSFAEIAANIHGEKPEELPDEILNQSKQRKGNKGNEKPDVVSNRVVENAEKLARIQKKFRKEYYQKELNGESVEALLKMTEKEIRNKIRQELWDKGICKTVSDTDEEEYLKREGFYHAK